MASNTVGKYGNIDEIMKQQLNEFNTSMNIISKPNVSTRVFDKEYSRIKKLNKKIEKNLKYKNSEMLTKRSKRHKRQLRFKRIERRKLRRGDIEEIGFREYYEPGVCITLRYHNPREYRDIPSFVNSKAGVIIEDLKNVYKEEFKPFKLMATLIVLMEKPFVGEEFVAHFPLNESMLFLTYNEVKDTDHIIGTFISDFEDQF